MIMIHMIQMKFLMSLWNLKTYMKNIVLIHKKLCLNGSKNDFSILFEGAQGTLFDIDHGTYPYVTSSKNLSIKSLVSAKPIQQELAKAHSLQNYLTNLELC